MARETPTRTQTPQERIAAALERIATAQEQMVAADPIAALGSVIGEMPEAPNDGQPTASNGFTVTYALPDAPGWEIEARRDPSQPSGWAVAIGLTND